MIAQFHLALPCLNIGRTRVFYEELLGAKIGRSSPKWVDVNLYGNQITFTECGTFNFDYKSYSFNGQLLPSFHFGIMLNRKDWENALNSLKAKKIDVQTELTFLDKKIGEHKSFFIKDPNGYTVEFKSFTKEDEVFKS